MSFVAVYIHGMHADVHFSYDKETGTGGSNGATMRFAPEGDHGANAGLKAARDFMEPVKRTATGLSSIIQVANIF